MVATWAGETKVRNRIGRQRLQECAATVDEVLQSLGLTPDQAEQLNTLLRIVATAAR
ncbi:hypothetical protein Aab01nite_52610 [Paractinoplanes abujensis]|uniref:Uncharacterized protein n=1 Tax=Paractinoplanes abujensis TaxID=882441 RepID=A0A7W7CS40_9ACTN|nr:hypothetical protein [Actinoplanes abujensis]MBB4693672.1 hypothetical protein [Actinoplanes abujensis]GID21671.1 hypothetical protein Aab01nite_52610 [Actinoplanes abujensis]